MIRPIKSSDIPRLVELGRDMHQLGIYSEYDFNPAKAAGYLKRFTVYPDLAGFVFLKDGVIQGGVFGYLDEHFFGGELIAVQENLFIHPDYRGGTAAIRLMKAFNQWAESHNVSCIVFETSQGGKDDRWLKFCENLGYEHVGYVFHRKRK